MQFSDKAECRRTARNEATYLEGGHVYVFFVYGMYYQLNVVTGPIAPHPLVVDIVLARYRAALEAWMRSYRPEELFDEDGRPVERLRAQPPQGDRRMSANPVSNGGHLADLDLPDFRDYAVAVESLDPALRGGAARWLCVETSSQLQRPLA